MRRPDDVKLIVVDFYGVLTLGSYKDTCRWIARTYKLYYPYVYKIVYHKYFNRAAVGKITEQESLQGAVDELGLPISWRQLRTKHLSFQRLNMPAYELFRRTQDRGYLILLLSKNTPEQFNEALRKLRIGHHFKHIINTYDLGLPKASPETMRYVLKRFRVRPNQVIMTDDQAFNLTAPRQLGVRVILYRNFKQFKRQLEAALHA